MKKNLTATAAEEVIEKGKRVRYDKNPFIGNALVNTKAGHKKVMSKDGSTMMVVNTDSGEIVAPAAGFWQTQEVDRTQFVKLYINGVKNLKELSKAGTMVFELLYQQVQNNIGKDQILLTHGAIDQDLMEVSKTTFHRGLSELIEKGFIACTKSVGVYFLNPDFLWNGDRLTFVKEFRIAAPKAKSTLVVDTKTLDMFDQK